MAWSISSYVQIIKMYSEASAEPLYLFACITQFHCSPNAGRPWAIHTGRTNERIIIYLFTISCARAHIVVNIITRMWSALGTAQVHRTQLKSSQFRFSVRKLMIIFFSVHRICSSRTLPHLMNWHVQTYAIHIWFFDFCPTPISTVLSLSRIEKCAYKRKRNAWIGQKKGGKPICICPLPYSGAACSASRHRRLDGNDLEMEMAYGVWHAAHVYKAKESVG